MDQDETWHKGRPRPGHIVLDGDPALPSPKGHRPPFSADVCCGQTAGWIKMPLGTKVDLGPDDIVLDGDPSPLPPVQKMQPPLFGPCIVAKRLDGSRCHLLGADVGLGPGHIVLNGDQASPQKRAQHPLPICGPCLLWPNGWIDPDATWHEGGRRSRRHRVR